MDSVQEYKANRCMTAQGRCLLILQSNDQPGQVTVAASADGVQSESVSFDIR